MDQDLDKLIAAIAEEVMRELAGRGLSPGTGSGGAGVSPADASSEAPSTRASIRPPIGVCTGDYSKFPELLGRGVGHEVFTETDFEAALTAALANRGEMHLIQVHLPRDDASRTLSRLADRLSARV